MFARIVDCMYQGRCLSSGEIRAEGITYPFMVLPIYSTSYQLFYCYCGSHYQWYLFVMATDIYSAHLWLFPQGRNRIKIVGIPVGSRDYLKRTSG